MDVMVIAKHKFVSAKADGGDSTLVKPSDWNDEHDITTTADGVVLGVPPGAGPGAVQELPMASVFPSGVVLPFAGSVVPTGWLLCDGALLNRADQPALFTAIGTAFNIGGEASTQFRIPDCRGRVVAGIDAGTNRLQTYVGNAMGAAGGQQQEQASIFGTVDVGVGVSGNLGGAVTGASGGISYQPGGSGVQFVQINDGVQVSGNLNGSGSGSIRNNGGNVTSAVSNVQPTIQMSQMIKT